MTDYIAPRRRIAGRGFFAGALLALGLQGAHAAEAGCQLKLLEMPVKMAGSRAIATVGINGTTVPLMVDTGAFYSMLTDATAAQLKLRLGPLPFGMGIEGLTGRVDAHTTFVDHLDLPQGQLSDVEFVVGGNEDGSGAMGMMGRNLLTFTDTEFDLAHGMIRFVFTTGDCSHTNLAYWAGETPVSELALIRNTRDKLPALRAFVQLNGRNTIALFDTGATTDVALYAAVRAGVKQEDMTPSNVVAGAGRGKTASWTALFDRVDFGGEAMLHNRLRVADFAMKDADMLVGIDFFLSHRILVSRKRGVMYFTYNGGPVFALNAAAAASDATSSDALTADDLARRGAASLARGDLASALADLDRACRMAPANAGFFLQRAHVHGRLRDTDATLADLDTALRLDPSLADARASRAWMHVGHQPDATLADLAELDRTLAPQSQLRSDMARLYEALDRPEQVIAQWTLWIAAHPHDIALEHAWNARCWARMELNIDLDKAMDDCDKAVDADDKNASYLDSRAWVYLRQGKPKKARSDFDRALRIKPDAVWSLYGRGLAALALDDATQAQADLSAARKADARIDAKAKKVGLPTAPDAPAN